MRKIDIESWSRKTQYETFIRYTNPVFSIGTRLDVTALRRFCGENGFSFFSAFLFLTAKSMNDFEAWRTRIVGDNAVVFEKTHPSYVVLREDDSIATCLTEFTESFADFHRQTRADIERVRQEKAGSFNPVRRMDCIYVSNLPWIDFSSVTNPYDFADREQTSIPRITWGKYREKQDGYEMAFDISAHHALVDGLHAARLIDRLEAYLRSPENVLGEDKQ